MTTAYRRYRKRVNHVLAGGHSVLDHQRKADPRHPGKFLAVNCPRCLAPKTTGFGDQLRAQQLARPTLPKGWAYKFKVGRRREKSALRSQVVKG